LKHDDPQWATADLSDPSTSYVGRDMAILAERMANKTTKKFPKASDKTPQLAGQTQAEQ